MPDDWRVIMNWLAAFVTYVYTAILSWGFFGRVLVSFSLLAVFTRVITAIFRGNSDGSGTK